MNLLLVIAAAVLLSLERICYVWIWHRPAAFSSWCNRPWCAWMGAPIDALARLFYLFKALQVAVFLGWCYVQGNGSLWPLDGSPWSMAGGALLLAAGQLLNASVFYRLGRVGVFYGNKFGYNVPWCHEFPFSVFAHPQYLGAVLSIWGFFLIMRFPHDDWYVLPLLETLYYVVGTYFESDVIQPESEFSDCESFASPPGDDY